MTTKENIFDVYAQAYESQKQHRMTLARSTWKAAKSDPSMYASTAERMLRAIGEPEFVDTAKDARLGRIFMNRTLKVYPAFKDFYGLEETIERIVGFFRHARAGPGGEEADPLPARARSAAASPRLPSGSRT